MYFQDLAIRATKICGDNGTEAAMDLIQQHYVAESKNGVAVRSPVNHGGRYRGLRKVVEV